MSRAKVGKAAETQMLALLLFGLFLLYLLPLIFVRPIADDFCAMEAQRIGVFPYALKYYHAWTGRIGYLTLHGALASVPYAFWPFFMAVLLLLWWAIVYRAMRLITPHHAGVGASLLLVATFQSFRNPAQDLWWLSGFLTYIIPLILGSLGVWLCLFSFSRWPASAPFSAMPLPLWRWRPGGLFLLCGVLGTALGFGVVLLAPGNAIRQMYYPAPNLSLSLLWGLVGIPYTLALTVHQAPFAVLALSLLPPFARMHRRQPGAALLCIVLALAACFVAQASAYYATSAPLIDRALVIPQMIALTCLMLVSYFAFPRLPGKWLALALFVLGAVVQIGQWAPRIHAYALAWDARTSYVAIRPDPYALDTGEEWIRDCYNARF